MIKEKGVLEMSEFSLRINNNDFLKKRSRQLKIRNSSSSSSSSSSSARRYSPGWALASLTISLHWSLFLAPSVQPLIPTFLRSSVTSSVHLNQGLPILLFAYSFPFRKSEIRHKKNLGATHYKRRPREMPRSR
jgi:hypothetical protein